MKLHELIMGLDYEVLQGNLESEITSLCWDSRNVEIGCLFICAVNRNVDRHEFAQEAVEKGAKVLVVEHDIVPTPSEVTIIKVENTRAFMSVIADRFYHHASKQFNLIGITGTNGKTSTAYFIKRILEGIGRNVGLISTIENKLDEKTLKTAKLNPTTPDSIELHSSFSEMVMGKANDVVMEVTSSALSQHRVDDCDFDYGVFTNLTQDHLEEHLTMENYKNAKLKLFNLCKVGIINIDDPVSKEIIEKSSCRIITYGIDSAADFRAENIVSSIHGSSFSISYKGDLYNINLKLPGRFNVYNALATIAVSISNGIKMQEIILGLSKIEGVKGRFEPIQNPQRIPVIVDYAHSPGSLESVLITIKEFGCNRLILVFGCGGDRDKSKRAIMGNVAGQYADVCIITSDNPRTEEPLAIMEDIEKGIISTTCDYFKIPDRKEAIYKSLGIANTNDIVLIAGKGHEDYQIIGKNKLHFDDSEVVKEFFK